jgi:quercetin dioxygenase-like cupin family protein
MNMDQATTTDLPRSEPESKDRMLTYRGRPLAILLTAERTNGQCSVVVSTERPGSEPPRHCHHHEDETCYVLAGALTYYIGDTVRDAPTGACIFLPRGVEHTFVVQEPGAQVLTFYTPGGFEGYVHEMGTLRLTGACGANEIERMITVAARYGCDITGPPAHGGQAPTR